MKFFVVCLTLCWTLTSGQTQSTTTTTTNTRVLYTGYHLYKVGPLTSDEKVDAMKLLLKAHEDNRKIVLLAESRLSVNMTSWLIVSPDAVDDASSFLSIHAIAFDVVNEDIQSTMDENDRLNAEALAKYQTLKATQHAAFDHTAYLTYDDQVQWMKDAATAAATIALTFQIGTSYEGRDIYTVGINNENVNLPTVWIHGNANPRNWLSSATALYIIDQILNGASVDSVFLRTTFRFFITPNLNPDGYNYTWKTNRMWTKTRSVADNQANCTDLKGVYIAGNFDANFGGDGCNQNPCSTTYCGPSAFSEPETQAARDLVTSLLSGTSAMFLSLDSFGQEWMVPWGCSTDRPTDFDEMNRVALKAVSAIDQVNKQNFTAGPAYALSDVGVFTGAAFDWAKMAPQGFYYAYSVRTRPASYGDGGFDVPPDQIIPSGQELFAGLVAACREMKTKTYSSRHRRTWT